jgi:hypothetical protein
VTLNKIISGKKSKVLGSVTSKFNIISTSTSTCLSFTGDPFGKSMFLVGGVGKIIDSKKSPNGKAPVGRILRPIKNQSLIVNTTIDWSKTEKRLISSTTGPPKN